MFVHRLIKAWKSQNYSSGSDKMFVQKSAVTFLL